MKRKARVRLRAWRTSRHLSQSLAAEVLGCRQSMLSAIELGRRKPGRELSASIQKEIGIRTTDW